MKEELETNAKPSRLGNKRGENHYNRLKRTLRLRIRSIQFVEWREFHWNLSQASHFSLQALISAVISKTEVSIKKLMFISYQPFMGQTLYKALYEYHLI